MWKNSKSIHVVGKGDPHSKVLIWGEALGSEENEAGLPFVGKSGRMLHHYLDQVGLTGFLEML